MRFASAEIALEQAGRMAGWELKRREPIFDGVTAWTFCIRGERWARVAFTDRDLDTMPPKLMFDYISAQLKEWLTGDGSEGNYGRRGAAQRGVEREAGRVMSVGRVGARIYEPPVSGQEG